MMKTLRLAHLSDTHLGYRAFHEQDPVAHRNQRAVDFERSFEDAITQIVALKPDLVVHSGDVFHYPRPDWKSIQVFISQMRRLTDRKIPAVVIGGNHDTPRLRTHGSVFSVTEAALPGVSHVCGYEEGTILLPEIETSVHCVPYGFLHGQMRQIEKPSLSSTFNLAAIHGGLMSSLTPKEFQHGDGDLEEFNPRAYDYVALGHHHLTYRAADRSWYAGSTERCGFSDEGSTPGFLVVGLERDRLPDIDHRAVRARPMMTLEPVDAGGTRGPDALADEVVDRVKKWGMHGIARVELVDPERHVLNRVQRLVNAKNRGWAWKVLIYAKTDLSLGERGREKYVRGESLSLTEMFEEFLETRAETYPPGFLEAFRSKGLTALADAKAAEEMEVSR